MIAQALHQGFVDRSAVRFLLDHHQGRLETLDMASGDVTAMQVRYAVQPDGSLLVHLPIDSPSARAIFDGAVTSLTVHDEHAASPGQPLVDEDGLPTAQAVVHVHALTDARFARVGDRLAVRLRICDLETYLRSPAAMT